jgi:cell division topological specificity factor
MNRFRLSAPVSSAPVARERLHVLLKYERDLLSQSDLIKVLREEIYAVVGRHVTLDSSKVHVKEFHGATASTVVVGIEIPNWARAAASARHARAGDGKNLPA